MENIEDDNSSIAIPTSGLAPLISIRHQYPAHHPNLASILALFEGIMPRSAPERDGQDANIPVTIEQDRTMDLRHMEFMVSIGDNLPESTTPGDEEEKLNEILPTESESPNFQIQVELTSMSSANPHSGSSVLITTDGPHTNRSQHYSNPKNIAYLLGMYLALLGLVLLKLIREKHTHFPIANPFIIISVVAYAMAFLDLCILSWIYERLNNSNSYLQNLYLDCYRILKDVYYILCILAFFTLLPLFLTLHSIPLLSPSPSPSP